MPYPRKTNKICNIFIVESPSSKSSQNCFFLLADVPKKVPLTDTNALTIYTHHLQRAVKAKTSQNRGQQSLAWIWLEQSLGGE